MSLLIFFIILLVLVIVHEFGHFFSAKKFGIRVDEFGFGFPPKLFGIKKGETEYTFNALPFGGFVKIFGENPNEESISGPDSARSFINKPRWQQAIVLFGGVFANFLLAWVLFSFGLMSGMPTSLSSNVNHGSVEDVNLVITSVLPDSPALAAGFAVGDKIISAKSGEDVLENFDPESFRAFVTEHPEVPMEIGYLRGGESGTAVVTPLPNVGVALDQIGIVKLPVLRAFWEGLKLDLEVTKGTAVGLYTLIKDALTGNGSLDAVAGPVGMVKIAGDASKFGFSYLMSFAGLISVNLAIINLLPFPALDGGRLFFLLIEKIKGTRISPKVANTVNMIGFGLLILLMVVVTYHDIIKLT